MILRRLNFNTEENEKEKEKKREPRTKTPADDLSPEGLIARDIPHIFTAVYIITTHNLSALRLCDH